MKRLFFSAVFASLVSVSALAQTILLDNFNLGTASGAVIEGTSWATSGNIVQNATSLTIGGSATEVNGWGVSTGLINVDASSMMFLEVTARLDEGNQASSFAIQFTDSLLNDPVVVLTPTSSFTLGQFSTVYIPVQWTGGFDPASLAGWSIGGGGTTSALFKMTFDNLALTTTQAIPEPSTYAMLAAGLLVVGFTVRRRMVRL